MLPDRGHLLCDVIMAQKELSPSVQIPLVAWENQRDTLRKCIKYKFYCRNIWSSHKQCSICVKHYYSIFSLGICQRMRSFENEDALGKCSAGKNLQKLVLGFLKCLAVQFVSKLQRLLCEGQEENILTEKIRHYNLATFLEEVSSQISRCSKCFL